MQHFEALVTTGIRLLGAFAFLFLIIGISGFLVPQAILGGKRLQRDWAVGALIIVGALVSSVIVTLAVRGAGVEAAILAAGVAFGIALGWLLTFPAIVPPAGPPHRLYRIVQSTHSDLRWQEGQMLCMRDAQPDLYDETLSIEVADGGGSSGPIATSRTCTITLQLVERECPDCPEGMPTIFAQRPLTS